MSRADERKPWVKWFHKDWRGDAKLHMCSLAARGLWMELLGIMWEESDEPGYLVIDGEVPTNEEIGRLVGADEGLTGTLILELEKRRIFSRTSEGVPYSRRLLRDLRKSALGQETGKLGGNPSLLKTTGNAPTVKGRDNGRDNGSVKVPRKPRAITGADKASRARFPEARGQRPESSPLPPNGANGTIGKEGNFDEAGMALAKWFYASREHHFPHTASLPDYSGTPTVMTSLLKQGLPPAKIQEALDIAMASEAAKGRPAPSTPRYYRVTLENALSRHHDAQGDDGARGGPSEEDLASARRHEAARISRQRALGDLLEKHRETHRALVTAKRAGAPEAEMQPLRDEQERLAEEIQAMEREAAQ